MIRGQWSAFFLLLLLLVGPSQGCASISRPDEVTPTPQGTSLVPTMTSTVPTQVPPGTLALLFYPPLVMTYGTSTWEDKSHYTDLSVMVNYLQYAGLGTCTIGVVGPSGFFPAPSEAVHLGAVSYDVTVYEKLLPGMMIAYYINQEDSLSGYDYAKGLPIVAIQANPSEWSECKTKGEEVLSTLHSPSK